MTTNSSILHLTPETEDSQRTLQLISLLLQYPSEEWLGADDVREEVNGLVNKDIRQLLNGFVDYLEAHSLEELTINYVETFDFNAKTNLYLTYLAAGEERERGQILISLKEIYAEAGFDMTTSELSDYVPLFLEFISIAPLEMARDMLQDFTGPLDILQSELETAKSPYSKVMQACLIAIDQMIK
ncbi:nitrate reductase molybdenum cofactor assembly chaperone [Aneurinibacillus terranovensis]|uniref:nitrate reductase molybdenum cofactor assembly chaperone n=1 Tax=Aneurinibacillus terranovensis TaxID=278991 RepID=UPI00040C9127|nr:nitrate reductase molybdenum cofactor assembly chaperone [Aneurinibacillus terranovensis]